MPMSQVTYTRELEVLILETLLPVYYKYYNEKGIKPSKLDINPELLKQIRTKTVLPALLRPKEKQS
jgi:hypothetical protein